MNRALEATLGLGKAHLAFLRERAILAVLAHLVSASEVVTAGAVTSLLANYELETHPG